MKRLLLLVFGLVGLVSLVHGSELVWDTPVGIIGLPFSATESLLGYDAVLKQATAGFSLPFWTDHRQFVAFQIGAIGAWPNNGATVEPYFAMGHDLMREIPVLQDLQSLHLNVFGRYASEQGKAGVGVSFSYSFAGSPNAAAAAQVTTPQPTSSFVTTTPPPVEATPVLPEAPMAPSTETGVPDPQVPR